MFARFDENPAMTLRVIKETKRYGRTDGRTHGRTHGQRENSLPPTNKVCGGYNQTNKYTRNMSERSCSISSLNGQFYYGKLKLYSVKPVLSGHSKIDKQRSQ